MKTPTIVKDKHHPNMFRIRWNDGGILSDLVNLSRANEAIRRDAELQKWTMSEASKQRSQAKRKRKK